MVLKLHSTPSTLREAGGKSPPTKQPPPSLVLPRHASLNNGDRYAKHPRTFSIPKPSAWRYEHAAKVAGKPNPISGCLLLGTGRGTALKLPQTLTCALEISSRGPLATASNGTCLLQREWVPQKTKPRFHCHQQSYAPRLLSLAREAAQGRLLNCLWLCCATPPVSFLRRLSLLLSLSYSCFAFLLLPLMGAICISPSLLKCGSSHQAGQI